MTDQPTLPQHPAPSRKQRGFDAANDAAAAVILADPERYDGIQLEWARLYVARKEREYAPVSK
jgi:hypothetical protein